MEAGLTSRLTAAEIALLNSVRLCCTMTTAVGFTYTNSSAVFSLRDHVSSPVDRFRTRSNEATMTNIHQLHAAVRLGTAWQPSICR